MLWQPLNLAPYFQEKLKLTSLRNITFSNQILTRNPQIFPSIPTLVSPRARFQTTAIRTRYPTTGKRRTGFSPNVQQGG